MDDPEKNIVLVLEKLEIARNTELLIIKDQKVFFIEIERLLVSLQNLTVEQKNNLIKIVVRIQHDKTKIINFLHDLASRLLSVRI